MQRQSNSQWCRVYLTRAKRIISSRRHRTNLNRLLRTRRKLIYVATLVGLVIGGIGNYHKEALINSVKYFTQSRTLLNITNFRYIFNPGNICSLRFKEGRKSILTVVQSSRTNFISRHIIRSTYGSVHTYDGWDIQVVFLVGMASPNERNMTEGLLHRESDNYGDIIMGNFIDTYRNLTYKHIAGYMWATEFCQEANYYLKADDDVIVDIFHAIEFLSKTPRMLKDYYCCLYSGSKPIFNVRSKWEVTRDEYPADFFPDYCGYAAYIVGAGTLKRILAVSSKEKYLFIDDVYVTGMLTAHVNREETDIKNKIKFIMSAGWWLLSADSRKGLEARILKKDLFNVVDESRSRRSCWVWDLMLRKRELSNIYPSTCNSLAGDVRGYTLFYHRL